MEANSRPPAQPASIAVPAIIAINLLVFAAWFLLPVQLMADHFLVSWQHLADGRYWVLVSSAFSHNMLLHLMINMLVLWSFGRVLEILMGIQRFLAFYLVAAVVSGIAHAATSTLLLGRPPELPALGASGAVAGLLLLFSLSFPRQKILIFGVLPAPALVAALAFIAIDIWGLTAQLDGGGLPIGHGAHLGGALTGILYFFWLRSRARRRR